MKIVEKKFEPFSPPAGALEAAHETAREILDASDILVVRRTLAEWSLGDLLGAFPMPGSPEDDGSAERYFEMQAAMHAGDTGAAGAYRRTAVNFRPINQPVVVALRGLASDLGGVGDPSKAASIDTLDDFGHVNNLAGTALRSAWVGLENGGGAKGYNFTACNIVDTLVVPARMAIALQGHEPNGNIQDPRDPLDPYSHV